MAVVGTKVYAATQNGLFYYDKSTQETTTLDKNDGLSDIGISRLFYLADQKRLLLAYWDGNLDFLNLTDTGEPGQVTNVNTIFASSSLPTARRINHINRSGTTAYLSTDFGLVVLDLLKNEIKDTYFSLRSDNTPLPILQTAISTDSLYALTAPLLATSTAPTLRAIRFATNVNIIDPANWKSISSPGQPLASIVISQNYLTASVNGQGVYQRQAGRWLQTQSLLNTPIRLFTTPNGLVVATNKAIFTPGSGTFTGAFLGNPRDIVLDGTSIWVADTTSGLLLGNAGTLSRITPEGPSQDLFAQLYTYPQNLVALPTRPLATTLLSTNQPPAELFSVPASRWSSNTVTGLVRGFNGAAYIATEQRLYLSTFGSGLWSRADGQLPTPVSLPATISPYISSLATDGTGNLWFTTGQGLPPQQATLHVRRADGSFQSFPLVSQTNIVQILPDDNGFLWLRPDLGGGLLVVDPQTNRSLYLSTIQGQGGLPTNYIRALTKDRNGAIWVGTDLGPTIFDSPYAVFNGNVNAQPPILNRRQFLANVLITAIAVDGGNRKWIGTQQGIYHVAPDGSQLLDTFTASNTLLPSNTIQAISIEPTSGKLFIQTPNGIISYQGPATEPADTLKSLTIFPNPVRPDFSGTVGIKGLTDNATVKILDAGGQLVYETRSQGGTATWNLIDYRGRQAQTGVYLVVVVTADGLEGLAGKLAVIR